MSTPETHLLIVDDDERIRTLLRRFLVRNGYYVTAARDAAQAEALDDLADAMELGAEVDRMTLWLPTGPGGPLASSPVVEEPRDAAEPLAPAPWDTAAVGLGPEDMIRLLTECPADGTFGPGLFADGVPDGIGVTDLGGQCLAPGLIDMRVTAGGREEATPEAAAAGGVTAIAARIPSATSIPAAWSRAPSKFGWLTKLFNLPLLLFTRLVLMTLRKYAVHLVA